MANVSSHGIPGASTGAGVGDSGRIEPLGHVDASPRLRKFRRNPGRLHGPRSRGIRIPALLMCAFAAVGCGGGGGSSGSPPGDVHSPPPPSSVSPDCVQTTGSECVSATEYDQKREEIAARHRGETDFQNQWGLRAINADRAYADLELTIGSGTAPGADVTVGFIDTGIDTAHPVFKTPVEEEFLLGRQDEDGGPTSHGTMVASVVGSSADGIADDPGIWEEDRHLGFRGVAPGAALKMFAIDLWGTGHNRAYNPATLDELDAYDDHLSQIFDHVLSQGADIVNISVGFEGIIDSYTEEDIRTHFRDTISAMAQEGASDKKILVWAAGNNHGAPCLPTGRNVEFCKGFSPNPPPSEGSTPYRWSSCPASWRRSRNCADTASLRSQSPRTATGMDTPRSPPSRTGAESPPTGASQHPAWKYSWRCSDGK